MTSTIVPLGFQICDPAGLVQITKTPESRKYEKNTKNILNPPSRVGARKYEKITEKLQKWRQLYHPYGAMTLASFSLLSSSAGMLRLLLLFGCTPKGSYGNTAF